MVDGLGPPWDRTDGCALPICSHGIRASMRSRNISRRVLRFLLSYSKSANVGWSINYLPEHSAILYATMPRLVQSIPRFPSSEYPERRLVMQRSGVSNLEQVTFGKMLMFPAMYHHHKVRMLKCMVRGIFEYIWETPDCIERFPQLRFMSIRDFLEVSEHDFFALGTQEPKLAPRIQGLLNRRLLQRCLVISMDYILSPRARKDDLFKVKTEDHPDQIRNLRELLWDYLPKRARTDFHELWIDLPKLPAIGKDADECLIDSGTSELSFLRDYFPYPRWVESYQERKWKGHVFYSPSGNLRWAANKAARRLLRDVYGVHKLDPRATEECRIPD